MRRILTNKLLQLFLLLIAAVGVQAQEQLFDLNVNHRLSDYEKYMRSEAYVSSRAAGDTLDLPFFDDFSEPFSRLRNLGDDYPNPDRWIGNKVYINNHYAINPISQGVATFDGLDERGQAYGFGFSLPSASDTLKSKPLNLGGLPADSTVWLSFYYQPQGLGNAPEEEDLLVVQFKDTADNWETVWEAEGENLEVFDFKRAMVAVADSAYMFDGFQFQFVNYASRSGSVDHWHVDYIELDTNRSLNDTLIDDVAFMGQTSIDYQGLTLNATSSVLKEFNNMPWTHFKENPSEFLGDSTYFSIRNNLYESSPAGGYTLQIYNANGTLLHTGVEASPNVYPNVVCGNEPNTCAPTVGGVQDLLYNTISYQLPTDVELTDDSMFFEIVHDIDGLDDAVATNDRTSHEQLFYNYYAYDDGTAEAAYGLGELENVGRVAVKYEVKKDDILRSIQLYLNPVEFDLSLEPVQLAVWTGGEEPGDTLWTSPSLFLNYTDHVNYFYHYFLDREIQVNANSTIFIGWIQQPATNLKFSVGFDKRADNSDKLFYNLGTVWNQSSIPGSVMIRPVFGEAYEWVGVEDDIAKQQLNIYPNPSNGTVFIQEQYAGQLANAQVNVFDLSGRTVHQQTGLRGALQLSHLHKGVYLLRVDADNASFTNRLVLQ